MKTVGTKGTKGTKGMKGDGEMGEEMKGSASKLAKHHVKGNAIEDLILTLPLTLTQLGPVDLDTYDDQDIATMIAKDGIEGRRVDYMFPRPIEWIDKKMGVHIL